MTQEEANRRSTDVFNERYEADADVAALRDDFDELLNGFEALNAAFESVARRRSLRRGQGGR